MRTTREFLKGPGKREIVYRERRVAIEQSLDYSAIADLADGSIREWHSERRDAARASAGFLYQVGKIQDDGETVRWEPGIYVAGTSTYGIRAGNPGWDAQNPSAVGDARIDIVGRLETLARQGFMGDEDGSRAIVRVRAIFLRLESKRGGFAEDNRTRKSRKLKRVWKNRKTRELAEHERRSSAARKAWKARKARELAEHERRSSAARKAWKARKTRELAEHERRSSAERKATRAKRGSKNGKKLRRRKI